MPGHLEPLKSTSKAPSYRRSLNWEILPSETMPVSDETFALVAPATMPQKPCQTDFQLVRVKNTWFRIKKGEALSDCKDEITLSEAKM